jgi:uncharacterized protein
VSVIKTWQPFGNTDVNITTPSAWNYALELDPSHPDASLTFKRVASQSKVAFNSSAPNMLIRARARRLPRWHESFQAADEPPPSPVEGASSVPLEDVVLVPYGATELRMSALPWIRP